MNSHASAVLDAPELLSVSGFSLGPEFKESLNVGPKFSRVKTKFPRVKKIINGQNYLVNMDRYG